MSFFSKLSIVVILITSFSCTKNKSTKIEDQMTPENISYYMGAQAAYSIKKQDVDLKKSKWQSGFNSVIEDDSDAPDEAEVHQFLTQYAHYKQSLKNQEIQKREQAGQKFFEENAKNKNVSQLGKFIQFSVQKTGTGHKPVLQDNVTLNVRGFTLDGQKILDTHESQKPIKEKLISLIPGWRTILQDMKEGSVYTVWLAPEVSYGAKGSDQVPAYSYLKYDIELVRVEKTRL